MSQLLLDTHTLIWFVSNDAKLPNTVRETIETSRTVFFSLASLWEIAIKLNLGKLALKGTFEDLEPRMVEAGITTLPVTFADTAQYRHLPLHHRDPFDRILVAQAINYSLILISRDAAFDAYDVQRMWA
ncbi:MAG: type II toxin-antitoxin system VapC family toxin [Leptolyngbya sp. SIOISBB]|nr:type II toxin-antitoxin system VapC family toxin [Leptolyngbya sp. SIOISBB]